MKEVEIKVRNINKSEIIKKIEKLGGKKIFTGRVIDYRFDTPNRDLSRQGKALRIRQKGRYFYLNLKGKKKSVQNIIGREELSVKLNNFKIMYKILNELGYIKIFELNKYRTEYRFNSITFDIDEYLGMAPILEIESNSYDKVEDYMKQLDIQEKNTGRVYIREILAAKKRYDKKKALKDELSDTVDEILNETYTKE